METTKIRVIESVAKGYYHEAHLDGCKDILKKAQMVDSQGFVAGSLAEAKEMYEGNNEAFDSPWIFEEHCKVLPCVRGN